MKKSSNQFPEKFSIEQAFTIRMLFFYELWRLVEPRVREQERITGTYSLFFITICTGDESDAEWNEAVRRAIKIPKEKQKTLKLNLSEVFLCVLEFCKLYNDHYENRLIYAVSLLKSMSKNPEQYKLEWKIWDKAIEDTVNKYMESDEFDWTAELPTCSDQRLTTS